MTVNQTLITAQQTAANLAQTIRGTAEVLDRIGQDDLTLAVAALEQASNDLRDRLATARSAALSILGNLGVSLEGFGLDTEEPATLPMPTLPAVSCAANPPIDPTPAAPLAPVDEETVDESGTAATEPTPLPTATEGWALKLHELKRIAKSHGIDYQKTATKADLISLLGLTD